MGTGKGEERGPWDVLVCHSVPSASHLSCSVPDARIAAPNPSACYSRPTLAPAACHLRTALAQKQRETTGRYRTSTLAQNLYGTDIK